MTSPADQWLKRLVPDGLIVIVTIDRRSGTTRQTVHKGYQSALSKIAQINLSGDDCYFGLGNLKQPHVIGEDGKRRFRVSSNIASLKTFFLDIDIDPHNADKYDTQAQAKAAVFAFCQAHDLPVPMIVSSGRGLHVYWPLSTTIPGQHWRKAATLLKRITTVCGLKADPVVISDLSQILRVINSVNTKNGAKVEMLSDCPTIDMLSMVRRLGELANELGVLKGLPEVAADIPQGADMLGDNTKPVFEPSNFGPILKQCAQVQKIALTGGTSEPIWYAGLGLARHLVKPEKVAVILSQRHKDYREADTIAKMNQVGDNVGPTTCERFDDLQPGICNLCPQFGKLTSPIQLGRAKNIQLPEAEVITEDGTTVKIPQPPHPYRRSEAGVSMCLKPAEGSNKPEILHIFNYDIYPVKRVQDEANNEGVMIWHFALPSSDAGEIRIPHGMMSMPDKIHEILLKNNVMVEVPQVKLLIKYMTAYIAHLQQQAKKELLLAKLGWRDGKTAFVLGNRVYHRSGKHTVHTMSENLTNALTGLRSEGTLDGWRDTVQFYNAAGHNAHRFALYASMGSPIFHMTGHKGAMVYLCGKSGYGKTTVLRTINSVWGHPTELEVNGTRNGMTENAVFSLLSMYKNLPICMDDMTNWDPKVFANIALCISQGSGKRRSTRTGALAELKEFWELLAFISANTDAYTTLARDRGDAAAEAMRIMQIQMTLPKTYTKKQADQFANVDLMKNFGHAGHVLMPWMTENYDKVYKLMLKNVDKVSAKSHATSSERFWSGIVGTAATTGIIARRLNLLPDFPIEEDIEWAIDQIDNSRKQVGQNILTPAEFLAEYLDSKIDQTLVLSKLDQRTPQIDQEPRASLCIRHEMDTNVMYILKSDIRRYCVSSGVNFGDVERALLKQGILTSASGYKVLGSGTDLAKGQVRVWTVNVDKLT